MKPNLRVARISARVVAAILIFAICGAALAFYGIRSPETGPGMVVTYSSAIRDITVIIRSARLPNGAEFPHGGAIGFSSYPLGGKTMGAAPDGRQLPEWIDFAWTESPENEEQSTEENASGMKRQRVYIRDRIPQDVLAEVLEAKQRPVEGHGYEKNLEIAFVWTSNGIKLRWQIWHTPAFNVQYDSKVGGDEFMPTGTTMIVAFSSKIRRGLAGSDTAIRYPPLNGDSSFPSVPCLLFSERLTPDSFFIVDYEHADQVPDAVQFDWRLLPMPVPREPRESDTAYESRIQARIRNLAVHSERVEIASRIPETVKQQIRTAAKHAVPSKLSSHVIFLYFILTDQGIKLRWRLVQPREGEAAIELQAGGDEI